MLIEISDARSHPSLELGIGLNTDHLDIRNEGLLIDLDRLIGTEGRKNLGREVTKLLVVLKSIRGIVCGADHLNVRSLYKLLRSELVLSKTLIDSVPDSLAGILGESLVDIEISLKLEVSPVIKRVADKKRNGARKRLEFLVIVTIASYKMLVYSVCAKLTSLVVVTSKKKFKSVFKLIVFRNHLRTKMAMIVYNWKILYHSVKLFRGFGF